VTYRDLLGRLSDLTNEQLDQTVMVLAPHWDLDRVALLEPVYGVNTLANYGVEASRSTADGKHHPTQLVLLRDTATYDANGDRCYEWTDDDKFVGTTTGKVYDAVTDRELTEAEAVEWRRERGEL
jgi:hypothetical protein